MGIPAGANPSGALSASHRLGMKMRLLCAASLLVLLALSGCQPQKAGEFRIVDGTELHVLITNERIPDHIVSQAGLVVGPADELLFDGQPVDRNIALPATVSGTLQILRALSLTINGTRLETAARTVGEALSSANIPLHVSDGIVPSPASSLDGPLSIQIAPARDLTIRVDGLDRHVISSAQTVGAALAEAGTPLLGLDFSKPAESQPIPADGNIQLVRVSESAIFAEKLIPFQNQFQESADVALGQEHILQPGVPGLAVSRVRIRYEDGQEVSRQTESEAVVRLPQDRITVRGTKIEMQTATINGVTIQYWLKLQMYATVYSPCNSGTGSCSSGTASGLKAGKGVVAVDPGLYASINGQRLYIPGYGPAVVGDIGGGYIVEQNIGVSRYRWIDLGFDDNNIVDMTGWVTVYFLAPAPATIPDVLK